MRLWPFYHEEIPRFILEFASTEALNRLKNIGMHCGLEYTHFPHYADCPPYSRYDHSIGVALIIWHFTGDRMQTVAGLLHDISTPVFAHTVDFLYHDHLSQEATEAKTLELISGSGEIMSLLRLYGLNAEDVGDYHRYPIADNDSPQLSADRLEYTLGNAVDFRFRMRQEAAAYYKDLTVIPNETGAPEIAFRTAEAACAFTEAALMNSRVYVCDADRYAMQVLADILRHAMVGGILREDDLYKTEPEVIAKLKHAAETADQWETFRRLSKVYRSNDNPGRTQWISVDAKKRYINPLVAGIGRVSQISEKLARQTAEFLGYDLSYWITAT